jgi:hypothetical protein
MSASIAIPATTEPTVGVPEECVIDEVPRSLLTLDQLLRDRGALRARIAAGRDLPDLARSMVFTAVACGLAFGGALGAFHGGWQIAIAALKLPIAILVTAAICAPTLTALNVALDRPASLRKDLALVLSSLALGSLVLAAESPILLAAIALGVDYHAMFLLAVGCCSVAGAAGVGLLWDGLGVVGSGRFIAGAGLLGVIGLVGAQLSWTMRPFLVHPRSQGVSVVRRVDGNLFDAAIRSVNSVRGIYEASDYNAHFDLALPDGPRSRP